MRRDRKKAAGAGAASLSPDMVANIHSRLSLFDRLAFAAAFPAASREAFKPEAPLLVLPDNTSWTVTLFSLADRRAVVIPTTRPDHVVLGSSSSGGGGWLFTADASARMQLVNPVTGEKYTLPDITTIPHLYMHSGGGSFTLSLKHFVSRSPSYYHPLGDPPLGGLTLAAERMREIFYRKIVLSDSSRRPAAMLITGPRFGVTAFAMGDGVWRLAAPSGDGGSKYLVAAPDGRLMAVTWDSKQIKAYFGPWWTCSFKVHVLDGKEWKETNDIGDATLFVGLNSALCVSTREHPELRAGCVYYIADEEQLRPGKDDYKDKNDRRGVGVYNLKDGTMGKVEGLWQHRSCPLPAWFMP
ncbi:unnamed protein product [Alopecurus aequalis]